MNIHLPAILMFTRGTRFWHTAICFNLTFSTRLMSSAATPSIIAKRTPPRDILNSDLLGISPTWGFLIYHIPGYSLVTNFFPGQILVWFLTIFWRFTHFKIKMTISRKNMPLHVFIFESWWICPGISALFPGISAFFPGISAQKNRHIFTQSRVRSAQKARNPKLTTIIKKWPFPAPSQEIRPKGRNLGNGHLFVSFRRSRYIYIYIYDILHTLVYVYVYYICMYAMQCNAMQRNAMQCNVK